MAPPKPLHLDGCAGEGGGQLVRLACALAAVTSKPVCITNVRGNRGGPRGGGLKSQHVTAIRWLAEATEAEVDGLDVGSHRLEFKPKAAPTALKERKMAISAGSSASSTLLIFQAVFPYLLFAGNGDGDPIEVEIHGGTNVSFSLSYEYFDQVLLPALQDRFGIVVERQLRARSWSVGPSSRGSIWFRFQPLPPGAKLEPLASWDGRPVTARDLDVKQVDVSMLVPGAMRQPLQEALARDLDRLFPGVDVSFAVVEDSGHDARMYALLVAHSETGLRWGRDYLYDRARKKKTPEKLSSEISRKVCKELFDETAVRGVVDEHLEDQLVVFQALAAGRTSFPRGAELAGTEGLGTAMENLHLGEGRMRRDKALEPFGEGSMHTTTARWVASELLPTVQWFNKGTICDGAGVSFPP